MSSAISHPSQPQRRTSTITRCDCSACWTSRSPQGSTWRLQKQRKRTCEHPRQLARQITDDPRSLYLDRMRRFTSILAHTADRRHHTGIKLQAVPKMKYALRLLVDNEERELERTNNWIWEPAQPLYAPRFIDTCT